MKARRETGVVGNEVRDDGADSQDSSGDALADMPRDRDARFLRSVSIQRMEERRQTPGERRAGFPHGGVAGEIGLPRRASIPKRRRRTQQRRFEPRAKPRGRSRSRLGRRPRRFKLQHGFFERLRPRLGFLPTRHRRGQGRTEAILVGGEGSQRFGARGLRRLHAPLGRLQVRDRRALRARDGPEEKRA